MNDLPSLDPELYKHLIFLKVSIGNICFPLIMWRTEKYLFVFLGWFLDVLIGFFSIHYLQRYKGNIAELELYFVILNNEYGERTEEELLQGGKDMRVTNENVITFIHLVSNHRLNFQVPALSLSFILAYA